MALFTSRYEELTFYVDGKPRSFRHGKYRTEDKKEIAVLEKLADVKKVVEHVEKESVTKSAPKSKTQSK